jgi:hypothetical protein
MNAHEQSTPDPAVADAERALAERLLEDETLRGDLDDATWQPLQDWLLAAAGRCAASTAGQTEDQSGPALAAAQSALRDLAHALTNLVTSASADVYSAGLDELSPMLVEPLVADPAAARAALADVPGRATPGEADPVDVATAITAALDAVSDTPAPSEP